MEDTASGPQGIAYILAALGLVAYVGSVLFGDESERRVQRTRERDSGAVDGRVLVLGLTLVLVVILTASMVVPSGTQSFAFVASEADSPGPSVIATGNTEKVSYRVPSNGVVPVVTFFETRSDLLNVSATEVYVGSGSERTVIVELTAPDETGPYTMYMVEHRYLALIPQSAIRALYHIHPWAPIVAIDAVMGLGFASLSLAVVGSGPVRLRSRSHGGSLLDRIRQWF